MKKLVSSQKEFSGMKTEPVKSFSIKTVFLSAVFFAVASVSMAKPQSEEFYSRAADEHVVTFKAIYKSNLTLIDDSKNLPLYRKGEIVRWGIKPTLQYLFGPLTNRAIGAEQKGAEVDVDWSNAFIQNGYVHFPYTYKGTWLILKNQPKNLDFLIPVPLSVDSVRTENWKACGDSNPDHQTLDSFWYYWDPNRPGCEHELGVHYQIINPQILSETTQTKESFPEYSKMIEDGVISLTFGFGYVEDQAQPNPFSDYDYGMSEFRRFNSYIKSSLKNMKYKETSLYPKNYSRYFDSNQTPIGVKYSFVKDDVKFEVKVVASAYIDQMEIFAHSFAAEHDDAFGWFGHSRVGNGFDAEQFKMMLKQNPNVLSISRKSQLIYWAGCNSYSYYTIPFFEFKKTESDVNGTKTLDIVSNGLPSYFSLNALNAAVMYDAFLNFQNKTSYQKIVDKIEKKSNEYGARVLINVLGDEDNNN